ncbi:MAG: PIN domain-containing protein [Bryobacteraceae bacterium]
MNAIFADTFYWIALTNPRDGFHHRVLEFSRSLRPQSIVTTDEVLTELLTFSAADQQLRVEASLVVNDVLADENVRVIPQTRRSFLTGFALYQARPDKGYSLTDCISMQTMRLSGMIDVLTNDKHFEQEGFRALFRDS